MHRPTKGIGVKWDKSKSLNYLNISRKDCILKRNMPNSQLTKFDLYES